VRRLGILLGLVVLGVAAFFLTFCPTRPLYMRHRSVDVVSEDGTILSATLSLPRWARKPVPAVVVVHGSGRLARNHLRGDVRGLVRRGIGVLAYDKRGVGASEGVYPHSGEMDFGTVLEILAQDATAAFAQLRREEVDTSRLGFFGASQASWIIPIAAERLDPVPRFHIILSGAAVSTGVENFYSGLTGDGTRPPRIADPSEVRALVEGFAGPPGFDPAPILAAQRIPTLWLLGDRDESVPTFASVRVLDLIRAAGNESHTVVVYPGVGHGLRQAQTGEAAPIWRDIVSWLEREGVLDKR
jgi:pimeloyl-ACP methyl ester carboxylesterase